MIEALKKLFNDLRDGGQGAPRFAENDYRLAAAALLVHASAIDGDSAPEEMDKVRDLLRRRYGLDAASVDELVAEATAAEREAVDLYRFTSLLIRTLDEASRRDIVRMMWEIVYADGRASELEDNLVWRTADLLGISSRERIDLRRQVAGSDPAANEGS